MKTTKLPNGGELQEHTDGDKFWYLNGKLHRIDGPAVDVWGYKSYYINGIRHREDGPAIEFTDGTKEWWLNGQQIPCITQLQFERLMKLKAFW
jgi:hypothetical protein